MMQPILGVFQGEDNVAQSGLELGGLNYRYTKY